MGTAITHYIPYDLLLQNGAEATANGTEMELNGKFGTLVVQVMGITSATITFEAIRSGHKGDAYAAFIGANRATGAFGSTATANGSYIFDVRGIKKFRARVSTYVSGTIYVHATATAQDAGMTPIPVGTSIIGKVGIDQTTPGTTNRVDAASYTAKEAKRVTLTPSSESTQTFSAACAKFDIINYGPGDIYVDLDSTAAIGGADDILIAEDTGYTLDVSGTVVHLIGASASVVQVVGVR